MTWFVITVENEVGLRGQHLVQAVYPSSAIEAEQAADLIVLEIAEWSTRRFPNIAHLTF